MRPGKQKSRTFRRVSKRTPSGRNVVHYVKRRPSKAACAACRTPLKGMPNARSSQIARLSKTEKRPQRPFGGVLCSSCSKREIIMRSRK